MQLQMSGAGPVRVLSAALEGVWRTVPAVHEIEVWPGSGEASDGVSTCNSAALYRSGLIDPLVGGS
jgi:hypothetical protein